MNAALIKDFDDGPAERSALSFDSILGLMHRGHVAEGLATLHEALTTARKHTSPETWSRLVQLARRHPLCEFLHGDPFTYRCYSKPRGYAGDATALDYVLRAGRLPGNSSDAVAVIHQGLTHGALAQALLFRRDHTADVIDAAARAAQRPIRVLAAGCGHLRECDRIRSFEIGRIAEIVAFDTDHENLDAVYRAYGHLPVTPHHGVLADLAAARAKFGEMDVVFCSGLMETLPQAAAEALARSLFGALRPGGMLVLPNFREGMPEAGYLDAFMDWRMTYRTSDQIYALAAPLVRESTSWAYSENREATLGLIEIRKA